MNSKEEKILSGYGFSTLKLSDDNDPITIGKNLYHVMQIADTMKKNNIFIHKMIDSSDLSKAINDRLSKAYQNKLDNKKISSCFRITMMKN